MSGLRWLILLLSTAMVAACGSDRTATPEFSVLSQALAAKLKGVSTPQRVPAFSRAGLDAFGKPLLYAFLQSRDAEATLSLLESNARAQTWATADGITLSLREGIVIATRGLGPDLLGSEAPQAARILAGQSYQRTYSWLDGADAVVTATYACQARRIGAERLVIIERTYAVQHVAETCSPVSTAGTAFQNEYWFENSGNVRQSTQWLGPVAKELSLRGLNP